MKDLWIKFGCFITGWNYNILNTCTEASRKQLKKYTSAILILIILWAFIGFTFAERYIKAPWWGCILASLIFVIIIVQVERQIILSVGRNWKLGWLRFFLAIIMAFIGSAIIDQIIFKDDIENQMIKIVDQKVSEQLPNRILSINNQLNSLQHQIDSLNDANLKLYEVLNRRPTIPVTNFVKTPIVIKGSNGQDSITYQTTTIIENINNPIKANSETNEKTLESLRSQKNDLIERKLNIEHDLRNEYSEKNGFLEELGAMLQILKDSNIARLFYGLLFIFLLFLELFVVLSKSLDHSSDYDLVIQHQLNQKQKNLQELKMK